jgi:hypothetical protein
MTPRKVLLRLLEALVILAAVALVLARYLGMDWFVLLLVLLGIAAIRVGLEAPPTDRFGIVLGTWAYGKAPEGATWPFAVRWWVVLPVLLSTIGATFGLTYAVHTIASRPGFHDDAATTSVFLLAWVLRTALLALSLGAAWTLLLALGRHLRRLPPASTRDFVLTLLLGVGAAALVWRARDDGWSYSGGESSRLLQLGVLGLGGHWFGIVLPALARRSEVALGAALIVPVLAVVAYGIAGPAGGAKAPEGREAVHVILITVGDQPVDWAGYDPEKGATIGSFSNHRRPEESLRSRLAAWAAPRGGRRHPSAAVRRARAWARGKSAGDLHLVVDLQLEAEEMPEVARELRALVRELDEGANQKVIIRGKGTGPLGAEVLRDD